MNQYRSRSSTRLVCGVLTATLLFETLLPPYILMAAMLQPAGVGTPMVVAAAMPPASTLAGLFPAYVAEPGSADSPAYIDPNPHPGLSKVTPSEPLACKQCVQVDVRELDLSQPPTEQRLMAAGALGGPLSPTKSANWESESDPEKKQRLKNINSSFGQAIQEWNKHNYSYAAQLMQSHIDSYPDSPWREECELHLGCDAKYNGRYNDAMDRYEGILSRTSTNYEDPTYDINQKAHLRLTDLNITLGKYEEALDGLKQMLENDGDWKRRTWARNFLFYTHIYQKNAQSLADCGTKALAEVFAQVGNTKGAEKLKELKPTQRHGFSLKELSRIAQDHGLSMKGFKAKNPAALAKLSLPLIIHYDYGDKDTPGHFLVVKKVENRNVTLFDPQAKRLYSLDFDQLSREWSGKGLTIAQKKQSLGWKQFAMSDVEGLSDLEMNAILGGCCGIETPGAGDGEPDDDGDDNGDPDPNDPPQNNPDPDDPD